MLNIRDLDIFQVEETICIGNKPTGISAYDFSFEPIFKCRRPYEFPQNTKLICRQGAFSNYEKSYAHLNNYGFQLINNFTEHNLASELSEWYPKIKELTPRSICYEQIPQIAQIENDFNYPIFIKGSRQTSKHNKKLSIANNRTECEYILSEYQKNSVLHWQKLVCREFIKLYPVKTIQTCKVPPSFEFRTFWYKNNFIGAGHYWSEFSKYDWTDAQAKTALNLAAKVSDRLKVPFLVIDLALTKDQKWIVIECNDGQESGYAGMHPIKLWNNIIDIEKQTTF